MYRISGGLGNVLIHLSTIVDNTPVFIEKKSKFLIYSNLNIVDKDDPSLETKETAGIYLNHHSLRYTHIFMRARISPAQNLLKDEHINLLKDVKLGISIRTFYETDKMKPVPIEMYYKLIESNPNVNIFIASDSMKVKTDMREKFGERISFLNQTSHIF